MNVFWGTFRDWPRKEHQNGITLLTSVIIF